MAANKLVTWDIQRLDITYKGTFASPQFALLFGAARSFQALHSRLSKFGLRLADIKAEGNAANPADFSISCTLPNNNAILRLRLESIELNGYSVMRETRLQEILTEGIEAIKEIGAAAGGYKPILFHQIIFEGHGPLGEQTAQDYLLSYANQNPWAADSSTNISFAFSLGADSSGGRLGANVVVSPSSLLPKSLYVQVNATLDGSLTVPDLVSRFLSFARDSYNKLGLSLKEALA